MTAFIQAEIMTRSIIDEDEVDEMMSDRIFFHDHLIERWMCDIDIDIVSQVFNSKKLENYAMECKEFVKRNVFILHDVVKYCGKSTKVVYVYDRDYLLSSFKKELHWIVASDKSSRTFKVECLNCEHVQIHCINVFLLNKRFNIIDCLHDVVKCPVVSTVGGLIANRQIDRIGKNLTHKDTVHLLFSSFMAIFSQVFKNTFKLNQDFVPMVEFNDSERTDYESRFDFCSDGHVFQSIRYEVDDKGTHDLSTSISDLYEGKLRSVYKSPIFDIDVDVKKETNGYYPGCKKMYSEHLCRRDLHNDDGKQFEDRGYKHLYEAHHDCSKDECEFCKKIITQHPHE